MQAVEENRDYDLIDPQTRRPVGKRSARELFEKIVDAAWRNGEPGIIFLDRLNRDNVVPSGPASNPQTPAANSPCCLTNPATWVPSTWPRWCKKAEKKMEIDWACWDRLWPGHPTFWTMLIDVNKYPAGRSTG